MSNQSLSVDMTRLDALIRDLGPKNRARLMRSAYRKGANDIKRNAFRLLKSRISHMAHPDEMRKSMWTRVYRNGFIVSVQGNKRFYTSRMKRGGNTNENRKLPLARWLETGTKERTTFITAYARGRLPAVGYMTETQERLMPGIYASIEKTLITRLEKIAEQHK